MADDWYIPESVTSVGSKDFYVAGNGIHVKRQCGDKMKDEIFLPKDVIIAAWKQYIPCKNKA